MPSPTVSIIRDAAVPSPQLAATLASVYAQDITDWELLIARSQVSSEIAAALAIDPRVRFVMPREQGSATIRRLWWRNARSKVVASINGGRTRLHHHHARNMMSLNGRDE